MTEEEPCSKCGLVVTLSEDTLVEVQTYWGDRENPPEWDEIVLCSSCKEVYEGEDEWDDLCDEYDEYDNYPYGYNPWLP